MIEASILASIPLTAAAIVDARRRIIPDTATALLAGLGIFQAVTTERAVAAFAVAIGVGLGLMGLRWAHRRLTGDDGIGLGDVKLLAAGSLWLPAVDAGAWIGASVFAGGLWMICRRERGAPLALFAAPLLLAMLIWRGPWPMA